MRNVFQILGAHFCAGRRAGETFDERGPFNILEHVDLASAIGCQSVSLTAAGHSSDQPIYSVRDCDAVIARVGTRTIAG